METQTKEDVQGMMATLLETAKKERESHGYSGDEKMLPMAFIFGESITMMMLDWKDHKTKYQMAMMANFQARKAHAKSLSFVTDSRWVKSEVFCEYFKLPLPTKDKMDDFISLYHRMLAEHGGSIKDFPRAVWEEAITVFTNGPGIPITIQMAPYKEGPNDTIEWLDLDDKYKGKPGKSDLLTNWWA